MPEGAEAFLRESACLGSDADETTSACWEKQGEGLLLRCLFSFRHRKELGEGSSLVLLVSIPSQEGAGKGCSLLSASWFQDWKSVTVGQLGNRASWAQVGCLPSPARIWIPGCWMSWVHWAQQAFQPLDARVWAVGYWKGEHPRFKLRFYPGH